MIGLHIRFKKKMLSKFLLGLFLENVVVIFYTWINSPQMRNIDLKTYKHEHKSQIQTTLGTQK